MTAFLRMMPGLENNERPWQLARYVVRDPDDGGVGDVRMGEQQRLEFRWSHMEPLYLMSS